MPNPSNDPSSLPGRCKSPLRARLAPGWRRLRQALVLLLVSAGTAAAAGPEAYVGNFRDNTVSVIDTAAGRVIATVPVANGPHGMSVTPDGTRVFVGGDGGSTLSVIDTASDRVSASIEVGAAPHGLAITPDGSTLLAAVYGENRIAFIDVASQRVTASLPLPKPHTIAIRPDGALAYVASQEPGHYALVVVDLVRRTVLRTIALDNMPRDPEFSDDGRALYVTLAGSDTVQVLDLTTERFIAAVPTGASPHIARLYRGAAWGTAVVQGPGELQLFDPASHAALRAIRVGRHPHWQASNDGRTVYVTDEGANDVTVVELASGATHAIAVGAAPRKIVVQPIQAAPAGRRISLSTLAAAAIATAPPLARR